MSHMDRYDRNSTEGLNMTTVNPCNNFIIDYLIRNKIKSDKQVSSKYYMYNLAIESVRKYPLPLVCEEQLAALEGFGNFFISRVAKVIKRHYLRGRIATLQEMDEDDKQHLEVIKETYRKLDEKFDQRKKQKDQQIQQYRQRQRYVAKIIGKNNQQAFKSEIQPDPQEMKILYQESLSYSQPESKQDKYSKNFAEKSNEALKFERIMTEKSFSKLQQEKDQSQKDVKEFQDSNSTKRKRNYRPRKGTQPYQILKALIKLKADKKPVIRGDINQFMFNERKEKMKGWTPVKNRLIQFDYIRLNQSNFEQIYLTEKGKNYVLQIQQNGQDEDEYNKNVIEDQSGDNRQHSSGNNEKIGKQNKRSTSKNSKQKNKNKKYNLNKNGKMSGVHYLKVKYKTQFKIKKEQLSLGKSYKQASLIMNVNSEMNMKDHEKISELLQKKNFAKYKEDGLSLGQFAWQIGETLLDFLVFRFKYEQFDLEEYVLTCQRARYSQCDNIYFIFEQPLSKVKANQEKQKFFNNIFAKSRVSGIKILKTKGISQTLSFLGKITSQLNQKIKSLISFSLIKPIFFLGTIEWFNENLKKFKPALFRNVALNCLRRVPHITKNMIKKIIRKMPGLRHIYNKLKQLQSNSERRRFLNWYLQSEQPKKSTVRFIVDLLFYDNYGDE